MNPTPRELINRRSGWRKAAAQDKDFSIPTLLVHTEHEHNKKQYIEEGRHLIKKDDQEILKIPNEKPVVDPAEIALNLPAENRPSDVIPL